MNPNIHRSLAALGAFGALALGTAPSAVLAQAFPNKPVKVIAAYPTGSGPDAVLRVVGDKLTKMWGQQILIENKPTANGLVAGEQAKRSPADGYTLLMMDDAHLNANPRLYKQIPYDTVKDFEPIARLYQTYFFFVVPASAPWKTMPEFIAAARAKGDKFTYGSWGIGSVGHLGVVAFEIATGLNMTHIPFQGVTLLYPAIGNNEVDWGFGTVASSGAVARSGKIRYLAAAAPKRVVGYPDIPTIAESGYPGFEASIWYGLFAPAQTPAPIVSRLNEEVLKAVGQADVREKLAGLAIETLGGSPNELATSVRTAIPVWAKLVKDAGIKAD